MQTPEEIADAASRIKEKRRQSAHRSRQRKSEYVTSLEAENGQLKKEVSKLRQQLAAATKAIRNGDGVQEAGRSSRFRKGGLRQQPGGPTTCTSSPGASQPEMVLT